jgi:sigma-E factor negative regulatory protein RseA
MAAGHIATDGKVDFEHLSSLIDGELDAEEAAAVLDALCRDPELQRHWSELQLVGDALRSAEVAACHEDGFCGRVRNALATEPTVLAPRRPARSAWRRYSLPGLAVAASVAAVAFVAVPLLRSPSPDVMAQKQLPPTAPVVASTAVLPASQVEAKAAAAIANARALDPYFAAHRELTGGSPLPRAAAYLRPGAGER